VSGGEITEIAGLTLRVALVATLVGIAPAIALAWILARRDFRGRSFVQACIALPMVLPPGGHDNPGARLFPNPSRRSMSSGRP
jgi:molybdate transport system permease protein